MNYGLSLNRAAGNKRQARVVPSGLPQLPVVDEEEAVRNTASHKEALQPVGELIGGRDMLPADPGCARS